MTMTNKPVFFSFASSQRHDLLLRKRQTMALRTKRPAPAAASQSKASHDEGAHFLFPVHGLLQPAGGGEVSDASITSDAAHSFVDQHPWSARHVIRVEPKYEALVHEFLREFHEIVGPAASDSVDTYLRITSDGGAMRIFCSLAGGASARAGRGEALSDLRDRILRRAAELGGEAVPAGTTASPGVEVFHVASINNLRTFVQSADSKSQQHLTQLVNRVEATTRVKPLARSTGALSRAIGINQFPNFRPFFDLLSGDLHLAAAGDGVMRVPPTLLLGPPGIGKTEVVQRVASGLGTGFMSRNLASEQSGASLARSDLYWSNSRPGALFELLVFGQTANPIVVLEELDKVARMERTDQLGALYMLLEKRTAAVFQDLALRDFPVDASHVMWFATANDVSGIEQALLSRFRVVSIPAPSREEARQIATALYRELRSSNPWGERFQDAPSDDLIDLLSSSSPRSMKLQLLSAFGRAATQARGIVQPEDLACEARRSGIGFVTN